MYNFLSVITKFISPPYCVACQIRLADYTVLCHECHATIPKVFSQKKMISSTADYTVHAFTLYQEPFDTLIQAKLYAQQTPFHQLGFLLSQSPIIQTIACDIIIPIPLHWQRKIWRGFNQAEILAESLAKKLQKSTLYALKRTRHTQFQSTLTAQGRKENLRHVFSLSDKNYANQIKNKRILLVDDLYTTGATAEAAIRELYAHGVLSVDLVVVCKVIH